MSNSNSNNRTSFYILIISILLLFGCNSKPKEINIIYAPEEPAGQIVQVLKKILEQEHNYEVNLIIGSGSEANLDSLSVGAADLSLIENYIPFREGIHSLLPMYPQILHVFYKTDEEPKDIKELLYGKQIYIGPEGSGSFRFMNDLFNFFQLDQSQFEITDNPFENDVYCGFSDVIRSEYLQGFEGFHLFSFDDINKLDQGSVVEGLALQHPHIKPFILPNKSYGHLTKHPIITLSTDAVLVSKPDFDDQIAYNITKSIYDNQQEFAAISPLVYLELSKPYDRTKLNFPIANGSRIYVDRDEPGFLERYAEILGLSFTLFLAIISAIVSFTRWNNLRKKNRIDVFYTELMDIKSKITTTNSTDEGFKLIRRIKDNQSKAFDMLIDEKLLANESFRIFMELSKETMTEVKNRIRQINHVK